MVDCVVDLQRKLTDIESLIGGFRKALERVGK